MPEIRQKETADTVQEIGRLVRAGFPAIYLVSWEEDRVVAGLREVAENQQRSLFLWSSTRGLTDIGQGRQEVVANTATLPVALDAIERVLRNRSSLTASSPGEQPTIFAFLDIHAHWGERAAHDWRETRDIVRKCRELIAEFERFGHTFVAVAPVLSIPDDLQKDLSVLDFPMPSRSDIAGVLNSLQQDGLRVGPMDVRERASIVDACRGLTLKEARNALAKAGSDADEKGQSLGSESRQTIVEEKARIIRKSGILEFFPPEDMNDVGGLGLLKEWLARKKDVLDRADEAREFGLAAPKGVLLVGIPGCGKSMVAKSIAGQFVQPLLRFDVGRVFGQWVGNSEHNIRQAINTAEALAPVVLWIDEVEKAFAGVSGNSDSGVTARVFGTFLSWLQDRQQPVFVVATANDIERLPEEFKRKGRFDEIFFVDLPKPIEREQILRSHLKRRIGSYREAESFDYGAFVQASDQFSGAEIEQAIIEALEMAFCDRQELANLHVLRALNDMTPIGRRHSDKLDLLRAEAGNYARPASE
jgi:AAA+ superfamily predicted ATPase